MAVRLQLLSTPFTNCSPPATAAMPVLTSVNRRQHRSRPIAKMFNIHGLCSTVSSKFGSTPRKTGSFRCFSALTPELKTTLGKVVTSHKVVLFMKGTKDFPQCGFSNTVVQILKSLYIDGEFFGGCDITLEAYQSGELQEVLEKAMCS